MSHPDSKYSCWWALPSSKQFSWFCRTARIITLLSTLSFNCNIYYVHYLKCSINPVPDVSCSSQNSVCLNVWLYLAWKIRGFVQKQKGGTLLVHYIICTGYFIFKKLLPLLLLPTRPPRPDAGISLCTWLQQKLMMLAGFAQKFEKLCNIKNVGTVEFSEWKRSAFSLMGIC